MALSGLRADYEIGKFGITPSHVEALKNIAKAPEPSEVAPSIYSGGGGPSRPVSPVQAPVAASPALSPQPGQTVGQKVAARWLVGSGQQPQQDPAPSLVVRQPSVQQPASQVVQAAPAVKSPMAATAVPFTTVRNGISSTPNPADPGRRDWAMGAPGSDGSMRGFSKPGRAGGGMDVRQAAMQGLTGRATIPGASGSYSFEGSAADAMKFGAPVATPARVIMGQTTGGDYRDVRDRHEAAKASLAAVPQYLGPESGLGWKTRMKKYEAELDAYNKASGNKTSMDIEAMREAGAGRRSMMVANEAANRLGEDKRQFNANQAGRDLDTQTKQMELDAAAQVDALRKKYAASGDPAEKRQIARDIMALSAKPDNSKYQIVTQKQPNPSNPGMEIQKNYAVNPDDPSQSFEIGGGTNNEAPLLPPIPDRVVGKIYTSPSGKKAVWDGKGLVLQK